MKRYKIKVKNRRGGVLRVYSVWRDSLAMSEAMDYVCRKEKRGKYE